MQPTPGRDVWRSSGNEGSHRSCFPPARRSRSINCFISTSPETPTCRSSSAVFPAAGPPRGLLESRKAASGDGAKRRSLPLWLGCGAAARWDAQLCVVPGPAAPHRDFGAAGGNKRFLESIVRPFVCSAPSQQLQTRRSRCGVCYCRVGAPSSTLQWDIAVLTRRAKLFSAAASPNLTHARSQSGGEWGGMGYVKLSGDPVRHSPMDPLQH